MLSPPFSFAGLSARWTRFFHEPADPRVCAALRIAFALVVALDLLLSAPHLELFWGEDGVLSFQSSRAIADANTWTVFAWLPKTSTMLWLCYVCALTNAALLAIGLASRTNAMLLFVWLVSFQHRNVLLLSGQDVVTRMIGFLLIFMPMGVVWSLDARWFPPRKTSPNSGWALRVLQIEMCWILWSAGVEKLGGSFWWNGDAMYYVMHLDDLGFHLPVPSAVRANPIVFRPLTWIALALELSTPLLLWFKETRRAALIAIVALHIGIEYLMNLVLFEWVMLVGWIAHSQPADIEWLRHRLRPLRAGRAPTSPSVARS